MMMPPLSVWQERQHAFVLHLWLLQAQLIWLGQVVWFVDLEDDVERIGLVVKVSENGTLIAYQRVPGADTELELLLVPPSCESGFLALVSEVKHATT